MKIKLDENLPYSLVDLLSSLGHEVDSVPQEDLTGQPDDVIWQATQQEKRFLITQDLDFSDIKKFAPGSHYGLLLVRLRSPGRLALKAKIHQIFTSEKVENWQHCFVVVTDKKLRIRRPD